MQYRMHYITHVGDIETKYKSDNVLYAPTINKNNSVIRGRLNNKYECIIDQELMAAAAYAPIDTSCLFTRSRWQHFCVK